MDNNLTLEDINCYLNFISPVPNSNILIEDRLLSYGKRSKQRSIGHVPKLSNSAWLRDTFIESVPDDGEFDTAVKTNVTIKVKSQKIRQAELSWDKLSQC